MDSLLCGSRARRGTAAPTPTTVVVTTTTTTTTDAPTPTTDADRVPHAATTTTHVAATPRLGADTDTDNTDDTTTMGAVEAEQMLSATMDAVRDNKDRKTIRQLMVFIALQDERANTVFAGPVGQKLSGKRFAQLISTASEVVKVQDGKYTTTAAQKTDFVNFAQEFGLL